MIDRQMSSELVCQAILAGWAEFVSNHKDDTAYAFALIGGQCANYLGFAIATEQGLLAVAAKYESAGYRYRAEDWQQVDNIEKLAAWLRWANPDDGWFYSDFPEHFLVQAKLDQLSAHGLLGDDDLEELCTEILASLQNSSAWREATNGSVIVGFTYGEDPRDFLRTATRCNPYPLVMQIWTESHIADELALRIERIE
jgi:hypothetical protein